jgi:mannose-6-phosphate isomerase-like protein (cupin superfamily)
MGLMAATAGAAPPKLPDATLTAGEAKLIQEPFGDLRIYFDGPTDQLSAMTAGSLRLNPGMSPHPPHRHPEEEFLLVTEGTGDISIGDDVVRAGPGAMMYCAANRLHGIVNTGRTPLLFYFYKWKK